jgi:hypothetical protein
VHHCEAISESVLRLITRDMADALAVGHGRERAFLQSRRAPLHTTCLARRDVIHRLKSCLLHKTGREGLGYFSSIPCDTFASTEAFVAAVPFNFGPGAPNAGSSGTDGIGVILNHVHNSLCGIMLFKTANRACISAKVDLNGTFRLRNVAEYIYLHRDFPRVVATYPVAGSFAIHTRRRAHAYN